MNKKNEMKKIIKELVENLSDRYRIVLAKRYGLEEDSKLTLEAIGKELGGITRERVRQIKQGALRKLKKNSNLTKPILDWAKNFLDLWGGVRKENRFLKEASLIFLEGGNDPLFSNQFKFVLELSDEIKRRGETPFYFSYFYSQDKEELFFKVIDSFKKKLLEINRPLSLKEYFNLLKKAKSKFSLKESVICSFLSISKEFGFNNLNEFGLNSWSEINPKKISEKIYLVFKKIKKPLHFQEASNYLNQEYSSEFFKSTTVHNELIRDPRFVLIGRGVYVLKEWGYQGGTVKETLERILKNEKRSLSFEEIKNRLKKELIVKDTTILLNLSINPIFKRTKDGKWRYQKPKKILEV
ncbi:hypothetical protein J7J41_02465 [bacterium]|nr:hypothetical protein [bacterium]